MKTAAALMLVVLAVAYAQSVNPGVKFTMQSDILTPVAQKVAQELNARILAAKIPDQNGSYGIPVLGKLKWWITNIKFKSLDFTDTTLTTVPDVGFALQINKANVHLTLDWEVKLNSIITSFDEKGTASLKTTDAQATWQLALGELNEHLTASLAVNSFILNNMRVHVTADDIPRWLLEIITALLDRPIKRAIESAVDSNVQNAVVSLNSNLQAMNTLISVGDVLALDAGYPSAPIFTSSAYTLPWFADWKLKANPSAESPAIAGPMPNFVTNDTINIMVQEYFYDTLGWALWAGQVIDTAVPMNTSEWKEAIPNLYEAYPNQAMTLDIALIDEANTTISAKKGVTTTMSFVLDYYMDLNNGSTPLVLQLSMDVDFAVLLSLSDAYNNGTLYLTGKLSTLDLKVGVIASSVGKVNTVILNTALKTLIATVIKPIINRTLGQGIPIPVPSGDIVSNFSLQYFDGYQAVTATLSAPSSTLSTGSAVVVNVL